MAEKKQTAFEKLYAINVNDKTEKKNELTYLSWAYAIAEFKKVHPDMTYEVKKFENGLPYAYDPNTGYMVYTSVTVDGQTHEMWLPVMDANNRAMKSEPYVVKTKYKDITVNPATMFDINKTIMRCLVKNLAMFGLGLYIYAGEDLPEETSETTAEAMKTEPAKQKRTYTRRTATTPIDKYAGIKAALESMKDINSLLNLYNLHKNEVQGNPEIKALFTQRREQLQTKKAA